METFKIVVKEKGGTATETFSVDAASQSQASCFARHQKPAFRIVSMKKIGWKLDTHFDFVTVSHVTHIVGVKAARKRRLARRA